MESSICRLVFGFWKIMVFFAGFCLFLSIANDAYPEPTRKVLILNSYHKEFKWTDAQVNAAKEVLSKGNLGLELFIEYMDTKRIYNKEYLENLFNLYRLKYKNVTFDAIITTDDNALWFVLKHHQSLFGGAPVCFCGINDYKKSLLKGREQFTGLVEILDIKATIDLALKLHPETRKIVVVVDNTPTGSGQLKDIVAAARQYRNIKFEYLEGKNLSHTDLTEKLRNLSKDSVVLLAVWLRDKNNTYLSSEEGGRLISQNAGVPVYGIIDMYFGDGIVGGKLLSSKTHGRIAAEKALKIMNGEKASNLPIINKSINPYMFDYEQLQRWRISFSDLPEDSLIINAPFSFYETYKTIIWIVLGLFLLLLSTVVVLAMNIVRRKHAEGALRESEERYRIMFQNTGAATVIIEEDMTISMANAEFENLTGFSKGEIENKKKWTEFVVPEHLEKMKQNHMDRRKSEKKTPKEYEFRIVDRQGNLKDIYLKIEIMPNTAKSIASLIDITLLKRTREALNKSESEKKAILDGITTSIRFLDENLNIIWVNKAGVASAKKASDEIIGQKCYEFWGNHGEVCDSCPVVKAFRENKTEQVILHAPDGKIWDLKAEPVFDDKGDLAGVVEIAHDITDQLRFAEQLQRAQKMEAIGTLAGGVAHDLNNILAGLVSYPELILLDLPENSALRDSILTIKKSGEKAAAIVQDLLTLARRGVVITDVINLNDVISEYLKSPEHNKLQSYHPGVFVGTHLEKQILNILGSPTHLSKAVMNMVSNAAEAMPEGGKISISTENRYIDRPIKGYDDVKEGDYVVLTIADTGKGISPKDVGRIFEAFYTKKKMGRSGTGLGMAVVWGTVKDHKGYIDVQSILGKGTTFTLYFPVSRKELTENKSTIKIDTYRGNGESILIVDDMEEQRVIASKMLMSLGYSAESVSSGEEAVEYLKSNKVDLLILDMVMDPGMDGLETYQKIIEMHPGQKAVIASGFSETGRVKAVQELGAGTYIRKPLLLEKLGLAVKGELEKQATLSHQSTT